MDHSIARKSTSLHGPQTAPCYCFPWAVARLASLVRHIPLTRTPRLRQDRTVSTLAGIVSCITRHIQRLFSASNGTQPSASWLQQLQTALSLFGMPLSGTATIFSLTLNFQHAALTFLATANGSLSVARTLIFLWYVVSSLTLGAISRERAPVTLHTRISDHQHIIVASVQTRVCLQWYRYLAFCPCWPWYCCRSLGGLFVHHMAL